MTRKQVRPSETKAFVVWKAVVLQNGIPSPAFIQLSRADGSLLAAGFRTGQQTAGVIGGGTDTKCAGFFLVDSSRATPIGGILNTVASRAVSSP